MAFSAIEYNVAGRVATVTLKRPQRLDAFTFTMRRELMEAFDLPMKVSEQLPSWPDNP
ncbi:hypothetical protein ABT294_47230 [Nonomuraea sp. NPDC000554]|uniref:hypothetical protein n=1 Tax=Nonomuraea sp. NPDC000554 TaxID=3154259 RepID=UPI0033179757